MLFIDNVWIYSAKVSFTMFIFFVTPFDTKIQCYYLVIIDLL